MKSEDIKEQFKSYRMALEQLAPEQRKLVEEEVDKFVKAINKQFLGPIASKLNVK